MSMKAYAIAENSIAIAKRLSKGDSEMIIAVRYNLKA